MEYNLSKLHDLYFDLARTMCNIQFFILVAKSAILIVRAAFLLVEFHNSNIACCEHWYCTERHWIIHCLL